MNLKRNFSKKEEQIRAKHDDPDIIQKISSEVISWLPRSTCEYIAVFIGTDRSTGDALGPLAGTLLTELKPRNLTVYGTLHEPVHATNLKEYMALIEKEHRNPFIIAVDACLGKSSSIGCITAQTGPVKPGAAFNKPLPEIGDIHLTGIVNMSGFMEYAVLQNTRLSFVMDMAKQLASILERVDAALAVKRRLSAVASHRIIPKPYIDTYDKNGLPPH